MLNRDKELVEMFQESESKIIQYSTDSGSQYEDIDAQNIPGTETLSDEDRKEIEIKITGKYILPTRLPFTVYRSGIQIQNNGICEKEIYFFTDQVLLQIVQDTQQRKLKIVHTFCLNNLKPERNESIFRCYNQYGTKTIYI